MIFYEHYAPDTTGMSNPRVRARKKVRDELQGNWQQDDDFFQRFFPINDHVHEISSAAKAELYKESEKKSRWLGVPQSPKSLGPRFYTGLNDLLNAILGYFIPSYDEEHPRLFIKTYRRRVLPDVHRRPIWPAILLAGGGSCFVTKTTPRPIPDYRSGICPFEVILEGADMELARQRLSTVVQAIFDEQPNRRFVFGLVISPKAVTCYLFDRSGVVFSPPLYYHAHPDQFCALIGGITSIDETDIGLDSSMFVDEDCLGRIGTRDPAQNYTTSTAYFVTGGLYHAPRIIGRGTTCFLAHRGDPKTPYVIKDAWISADDPELEGRDLEGSLLLHAKAKGVVRGVAQLCHSEEVRLKDSNGRLLVDDIYSIRRLKPSEHPRTRQRVHTRIVMSTYGKPLEKFSSRKELLLAYYDALRAHRNLYEKAGILHRDIKPSNILINADGEDGDRGILIDFDHAIRTDNTSPYSLRKKIGTYIFMSHNVIQGTERHEYLDDLESFYYVLVYMLTMFRGPHSPTKKVSEVVEGWDGPSAWSAKRGDFLLGDPPFEVQPWFGAPFRNLATRLYSLFGQRLEAVLRARRAKKTPPSFDPMIASDEFFSHVREAILELDQGEADDGSLSATPPDERSSQASHASTPPPRPRKRMRFDDEPTVASLRPLRQHVIYGRYTKH